MMSLVRSIRRRSNQREVAGSLLAQCWDTPVARGKDDWREAKFLACDTELSALDPKSGEVLSIGWVPIDGRQVLLNQGEHHLLKPQQTVGQSATIHQLRDCELLDAADPKAILEKFLNAAAGRILVFHHAELDMAFLNRLSERYFGSPLLLPCLDTLLMEKNLLQRRNQPIKEGELRLGACRARYNLPPFSHHNALTDALATAELFVAHLVSRSRDGKMTVGEI